MTVEDDGLREDGAEVVGGGADRAKDFGHDVLEQAGVVADETIPRIPLGLLEDPDFMEALSTRNIQGIFRSLQVVGVSQRRIGRLTGQSQSEISEIIGGRTVVNYDVLCRIADGLGIPRGWMGLAQALPTPEEIEALVARAAALDEQQIALGMGAVGVVRQLRRRRTTERPVIVLPNDTWTGDLTRTLRTSLRLSVRE